MEPQRYPSFGERGFRPLDFFFYHGLDGFCPVGHVAGVRQKPNKPLALDARCLLRAIDAVAARKSLKQAWIFSVSPNITLQGLCIHRKAINKDKPFCPVDSILPRIGRHMHSGAWRALL